MNLEERVEWISLMHKQNLNGRETEDELFEAGIRAGIEETEEFGKEEPISAFAFNVGRTLEKMCEEQNGNQKEQLEFLQTSVFKFREEIEKSGNINMLKIFDLHFKIVKQYEGYPEI